MTALVWGLGERKHQLAGTKKNRDRHLLCSTIWRESRKVSQDYFIFWKERLLVTVKQQQLLNSAAIYFISDTMLEVESSCRVSGIFVTVYILSYLPGEPIKH